MMQWPFLLGVVQQEVRMCTANFGQVKFAKMVQGEDLSAKPYHLLKITVWGKQKKKLVQQLNLKHLLNCRTQCGSYCILP